MQSRVDARAAYPDRLKKPKPPPAKPREPRLTERVIEKPDGRYLILYEPKRPREDKG